MIRELTLVVWCVQMMASKYLYDEGVDEEVFNDEWAENAGLEKEEVNNMELDFLNALVSFTWARFSASDGVLKERNWRQRAGGGKGGGV